MKISELIEHLQKLKDEHGDLNVCKRKDHEYWGHLDSYVEKYDIDVLSYAMPDGPKTGKTEKAIVIDCV
jgi:hypothetical protein